MKNKKFLRFIAASAVLLPLSAWAYVPTITLVFNDPQNLCAVGNKTQFAFNYKYMTQTSYEYFSGPVYVDSSPQKISVPTPPEDTTSYTDIEITDMGDCGEMDLDYSDPGNCYLTDLVPHKDQTRPYSYYITLIPQATGHSTYGRPMYNLTCTVEVR